MESNGNHQYQGHGCHDLASVLPCLPRIPPRYPEGPVNPLTFCHLGEDAQRMPHALAVDGISASEPLHRPAYVVGNQQVLLAPSVALVPDFGNPNGGDATFPQAQWFDCRGTPGSYNCIFDVSTSASSGGQDNLTFAPSSSQSLPPTVRNFDNVHERASFPPVQTVADYPPTLASRSHATLCLLGIPVSSRRCQVVGSPAVTQASMARRCARARQDPLYYCQVPGCTSQGFTGI
ncbi:hypothetical protein PM082_005055 [Marasmius tenuissimus]|nr:hypothetical protein PM082_005055 [Marasmius tenuissimus]